MKSLEDEYDAVIHALEKFPQNLLDVEPDGKWSALMHLDHLIKSSSAVNMGLILPKFIFPVVGGRLKRAHYSYDEVVAKYISRLEQGAKASGPYIPPKRSVAEIGKLLKKFESEKERMLKNLDRWSEVQMEKMVMPHPIIGKISVKEMLFFTIYHTKHHRNILEKFSG